MLSGTRKPRTDSADGNSKRDRSILITETSPSAEGEHLLFMGR